jgi:hypothetical protein
MSKSKPEAYPDVSDILARKEAGRRNLARLSFGKKIALVRRCGSGLRHSSRLAKQNGMPDCAGTKCLAATG